MQRLTLNNKIHLVKSDYVKPVKDLYASILAQTKDTTQQVSLLDNIKKTNSLATKYKRFKKADLDAIVDATKKFLENTK